MASGVSRIFGSSPERTILCFTASAETPNFNILKNWVYLGWSHALTRLFSLWSCSLGSSSVEVSNSTTLGLISSVLRPTSAGTLSLGPDSTSFSDPSLGTSDFSIGTDSDYKGQTNILKLTIKQCFTSNLCSVLQFSPQQKLFFRINIFGQLSWFQPIRNIPDWVFSL